MSEPGTSRQRTRLSEFPDLIPVLRVDEEPDFADLTATFLERDGEQFDVETARNADEGLNRRPGRALLRRLGRGAARQVGIQCLETVREAHPDPRFSLCTGKGSAEVASEAIVAGVSDSLQKDNGTSRDAVFPNRVANAVDKHRSKRPLEASKQRLSLWNDQSPLGVIEWHGDQEEVASFSELQGVTDRRRQQELDRHRTTVEAARPTIITVDHHGPPLGEPVRRGHVRIRSDRRGRTAHDPDRRRDGGPQRNRLRAVPGDRRADDEL